MVNTVKSLILLNIFRANKVATDAIKRVSKRATQKTAEATGDLIGNKIADKIIKSSNTVKAENTELNKKITKDIYI